MIEPLPLFLDRMWRTPFAWGGFDCITNLADWSEVLGAGDAIARYRGRYRTLLGAQRIIRRAGGLVALVAQEFEPRGWARTDVAAAGDIGVVRVMAAAGPADAGGLCLGDRWAVLGLSGVTVAAFEPTAVWSLPCPRP